MRLVTAIIQNGQSCCGEVIAPRAIVRSLPRRHSKPMTRMNSLFTTSLSLGLTFFSHLRPQLMSSQKLDYAENNHPFCRVNFVVDENAKVGSSWAKCTCKLGKVCSAHFSNNQQQVIPALLVHPCVSCSSTLQLTLPLRTIDSTQTVS